MVPASLIAPRTSRSAGEPKKVARATIAGGVLLAVAGGLVVAGAPVQASRRRLRGEADQLRDEVMGTTTDARAPSNAAAGPTPRRPDAARTCGATARAPNNAAPTPARELLLRGSSRRARGRSRGPPGARCSRDAQLDHRHAEAIRCTTAAGSDGRRRWGASGRSGEGGRPAGFSAAGDVDSARTRARSLVHPIRLGLGEDAARSRSSQQPSGGGPRGPASTSSPCAGTHACVAFSRSAHARPAP